LDLEEVKVWEQKDSLLVEFLKAIPVITLHLIEIGLGCLELFVGHPLHLVHMLMESSHLRLQIGILFHQLVGLVSNPTELSLQLDHLLTKGLS